MIEDTNTLSEPTNKKDEHQDNFAIIEEWQAKNAAEKARELSDIPTEPQSVDPTRRSISKTEVAVGATLVAGIAVGAFGIANLEGGSKSELQGKVDTSIESVTLASDATIRFDPYTGDVNTNTEVLKLDAQVVIDADHDIRVLNGTNNGTWYGIPIAEVEAVIPTINKEDKDGIVWVNEQGVVQVKRPDSLVNTD